VRRRLLAAALASLLAAALLVPTAQGATRTRTFRDFDRPGPTSVFISVVYSNKHRHGKFTPRLVRFSFQVPVSCEAGGNPAITGPGYFPDSGPIELKKGKFAYSYSDPIPSTSPGAYSSGSVTGEVIKKAKRVEGSVTVLGHNYPPTHINCTSGAIPYIATPCRWAYGKPSPHIKPSLPACVPQDVIVASDPPIPAYLARVL
jgi:hypothetical protein